MSDRNYLTEARAILDGTSLMLPEMAHLQALIEYHESTLIDIVNRMEEVKQDVLNRE